MSRVWVCGTSEEPNGHGVTINLSIVTSEAPMRANACRYLSLGIRPSDIGMPNGWHAGPTGAVTQTKTRDTFAASDVTRKKEKGQISDLALILLET